MSSLLQVGDWGIVNAQNMTGIMQMIHDSHGEHVAKKVRRPLLRCSLVVTEQDGEHYFLARLLLSFIHLRRKPFRFELTIKLAMMAYSRTPCPPFYNRVWAEILFTNDMSGDPYVCVNLRQMVSEFVSGSYTGEEEVALTLRETPPRQMILPVEAPTYDSDQVVMIEKDKTSLDLQLLRAAQVLYVVRPLVEWAADAGDLMLKGVPLAMTHVGCGHQNSTSPQEIGWRDAVCTSDLALGAGGCTKHIMTFA